MGKKHKRPRTAAELARKRPTGLDGTYTGTCIACVRPTDTALGFRGEPEAHAAFLIALGVPKREAIATTESFLPEFAAKYGSPDGLPQSIYRVCGKCAAKAKLPPPVLALPGHPVPVIYLPPPE